MENARDAGVDLAFFTGNTGFWKTRWEPSAAGPATQDRTLVSYKDTHFTAQEDPVEFTGTWRDPRLTTAATGPTPENALTGLSFLVNSGTRRITVPYAYRQLRLWRNTDAATLAPNTSLNLAPETLGYEWDVDADNGFRPAGQVKLSATTAADLEVFTDYGSTVKQGATATHNMTMYKAPSGARVFNAGTVQWSWGLDAANAGNVAPDRNMRQATVNLFADMGVQPFALLPGLVGASASTDAAKPTSTITSAPATVQDGQQVTIGGTASDAGGGVVAGVEISTDGGTTWHPANGTSQWSYSWIAHGSPTSQIRTRATDDSGNTQSPGGGTSITVTCPCSIWGQNVTPAVADSGDPTPVEVGVKFRSDSYGTITGVRFYKAAANTGTHTGSLWTTSGQRLAQATFTGETASGWQTVTFATPVEILPDTTYIASYHDPNGHYSATPDYFQRAPAPGPNGGATVDSPPLHALRNTGITVDTTTNGVYAYAPSSSVPGQLLRGHQLLGRRHVHADPGARRGDGRDCGRRRDHLGERVLVGSDDRRVGDLLQDHAVHRLDGADAQDDHGLAAGDEHDGDRPDDRDDVHVQGPGAEPERRRPDLGSVEPGDPVDGRAAGRADRRLRPGRVAVRPRQLDRTGCRRRQPDHRLHDHAIRRLDGRRRRCKPGGRRPARPSPA